MRRTLSISGGSISVAMYALFAIIVGVMLKVMTDIVGVSSVFDMLSSESPTDKIFAYAALGLIALTLINLICVMFASRKPFNPKNGKKRHFLTFGIITLVFSLLMTALFVYATYYVKENAADMLSAALPMGEEGGLTSTLGESVALLPIPFIAVFGAATVMQLIALLAKPKQ